MDTNEQAAPTARLNFGQRVADPAPVENTQTEAVQAEEAQQDAAVETIEQVSGEVGAIPAGHVDDAIDEAEAVNETMDELRVDPPADAEQATDEEALAEPTSEAVSDAPAAPAASTSGSGKSVEELTAEREKLDAEIKEKQDAEKASVIAQIKQVADTYGITADDLVEAMGGLKSKRKGVKAKPKYRDPATGVIWSGRGKEPAWIKGKNRDQFLIAE